MTNPASVLANSAGIVVAIGALGTASFGLVDASKVFGGGASNFGYGHIKRALAPFSEALKNAEHDWALTIRANWINGMPKEDQKAAAKSLIRLGLTSKNVGKMAQAGHVDETSLVKVVEKVEQGADLATNDVQLFGRFNAAIDAAMDAGFERADQEYRNACRFIAGAVSVLLAISTGAIIRSSSTLAGNPTPIAHYPFSADFFAAVLVGLVAVPIAPVAKDLASSIQAAANAVQSVRQ
jgi:hypothetical protein